MSTEATDTKVTPTAASNGDGGRMSNNQRVSQKKQLVKSYPKHKKLEKLAVYSSCKVSDIIG